MMKNKYFLIILALSFLSFFANIWGISIYSLDEAKNSVAAREMLDRGDFIVPTFNYEIRTDKPPLHYYFMIFAYKLFGVNEFSARFFSSVFGVLTVLITFLFARKFYNEKVAFLAGIVLLASLHFSIQNHMAVPDPYLIFFINASLFSFFIFYKSNKDLYLWFFYIFCGFGVLTKGPVAVVLPFIIVFAFLLYIHSISLAFLKKLHLIKGILIILVISLPWYIAVSLKTDFYWTKEFLLKHNFHRFSNAMEGHGGLFLLTILFVFIGLLPFSVFIIQALKKAWKEKFKDINVFLLLFAVIYVGFFSISSTKLPNYTVPVYPALAIIIAYYLYTAKRNRYFVISLAVFSLITVVLAFGSYFGLKNEPAVKDLAFFGFSFLFLSIVGVISLLFKSVGKSIIFLFTGSFLFVLAFFYLIFPPIDKRNPVQQALKLIPKKSRVFYYKGFNPAFAFYIKTPIKEVNLKSLKTGDIILTRKRHLKDLKNLKGLKLIFLQKDLFENKYTAVLKKI